MLKPLLNRIVSIFWRSPDLAIGEPDEPYLLRWYVIRKNRFFGFFLHKFLRDDYDRALHDHPWASVSILIRGQYIEITETDEKGVPMRDLMNGTAGPCIDKPGLRWRLYRAPSVIFRSPTHRHRVEMIDGKPAWTLFFTGPVVRVWGFWCPKGFVPWMDFVDPNDYGRVGAGCGEGE